MKLEEIISLIKIKEYIIQAVNFSSVDRKTLNELDTIGLLLDKKIVAQIVSSDFKELVNFEGGKEAKMEAVKNTRAIYDEVQGIKKAEKSKGIVNRQQD